MVLELLGISSNGLERIITINLEGFNELNDIVTKKIVVELMGKHSNIILLNENNIIIDSLRHLDTLSNSTRDIMPAREYILPANDKKDILLISLDSFIKIFENKEDILIKIPNEFNGISKSFINACLLSLGINNTNYSNEDLEKLYIYILSIIQNLDNLNTKSLFIEDLNDYVITLNYDANLKFDTLSNSENIFNKNQNLEDRLLKKDTNKNTLQTNFFLDDFYTQKENEELISNYKNNLLKLILGNLKKISKKIININQKLEECSHMEDFRIYGELITANLYKINNDLRSTSITLNNYYDNNKEISIPLDSTYSPSLNAKKYFKKYNKLKNTLRIVTKQKEESELEVKYLESIIYELENATTINEIDDIYSEICENVLFKNNSQNKVTVNVKKNKVNKKKIHDEFEPITYTVDGFTLYIGKNNKQNDYITTKLGKNDDIWFHTKDVRGSHALLKCNGFNVNQNTINKCAQITAFHSKAKISSNVAVDYCTIKNVKKPSGSKPGMVIYNNYNTVNVNPIKY